MIKVYQLILSPSVFAVVVVVFNVVRVAVVVLSSVLLSSSSTPPFSDVVKTVSFYVVVDFDNESTLSRHRKVLR